MEGQKTSALVGEVQVIGVDLTGTARIDIRVSSRVIVGINKVVMDAQIDEIVALDRVHFVR